MGNYLSELLSKFRPLDKSIAPKQAVAAIDGYEAATFTRDRSRIFTTSAETTANPTSYTRNEVLRISRYLANNFPLAERILSVAEIYGIGAGLIANATTSDKAFNQSATQAFDQWGASSFCSANNHYNLYEIQKLLARELILAGEVFIILVNSPSGYPQLQLVQSENVRKSGDESDDSVDGLYVDDYGKVTAYNIFSGKKYQKVDASNVIHLVRHKQIGQLRGMGSFAASLNSMRDYKDCVLLEKKAVKVHSTLALVLEKQGGEATNGLLGGDDLRIDSNDGLANGASNKRLENAFGGAGVVLDKGESLKLLSSDRSTDGFLDFLELLVREVCLNISLPYEFLVNPEKLNGTAMRFVISDAAAFFRDIQDRILDSGMRRIYGWVIASFIRSKTLSAPVGALPYPASFTRPQSITVDPQRISNAEIAQLQNSLLTYEAFYSARGRDWREELRQHAEEEKYLDELSRETGVNVARLRALPAGSPILDVVEQDAATDKPDAAA